MQMIDTGRAIAAELWTMGSRPREAARARQSGRRTTSPWTVLGAATATMIVLFSLYGLAFGSLIDNATRASGLTPSTTLGLDEAAAADLHGDAATDSPRFTGIRFLRGFGLGVFVYDTPGSAGTGTMLVRGGLLAMTVAGVETDGLVQGAFPFILAGTFAFLVAVCLHPPARVLGGAARFPASLSLALVYCAFAITVVSLISLVAVLLLVHLLGLEGRTYQITYTIATQVPILGLLLRSYFAGFSEHFQLPVWRVVAAAGLGLVLSAVAAPIILFPVVYATVRLQPVLDLLA